MIHMPIPPTNSTSKFVFLLSSFNYQGTQINVDEIGIVEDEKGDTFTVLFIRENILVEISKNFVQEFNPSQTGDAFEKKVCNVCHRLLPATQFEYNQNGRNNRRVRRPSCRDCRRVINGVDRLPTETQIWEPLKPYLVSFKCPICGKITVPGLTSKVVLDHDHKTGKARTWICDSCNTGIGRFKDDIELLRNAIKYLEESQEP